MHHANQLPVDTVVQAERIVERVVNLLLARAPNSILASCKDKLCRRLLLRISKAKCCFHFLMSNMPLNSLLDILSCR